MDRGLRKDQDAPFPVQIPGAAAGTGWTGQKVGPGGTWAMVINEICWPHVHTQIHPDELLDEMI